MNINKLKYPIGEYYTPKNITNTIIKESIITIKNFPFELEKVLKYISKGNLSNTYRLNGWNGFQVIHHCADSHINGYVRFKLTLTEDKPVIKPYIEEKWAELVEAKTDDIQPSLFLIKGLHQRWSNLLETISKDQWELYYIHPEDNKETNLKSAVCLYAWHCKHHLEHLKLLKNE
jgi:hypothetical protein